MMRRDLARRVGGDHENIITVLSHSVPGVTWREG